MKINVVIKYNGEYYKQPNCRVKIDQNGGITTLVNIDGKFQLVKGEIVNIVFESNETK